MSVNERIPDGSLVFLDSAPVIYYVERKRPFFEQVSPFFARLDDGELTAVSSPITVAECIFYPYKQNNLKLAAQFRALLTQAPIVRCVSTTDEIADSSARLRAQYNLGFADALQVATAVYAGCEFLLTNDMKLQRVAELDVIVLGGTAVTPDSG